MPRPPVGASALDTALFPQDVSAARAAKHGPPAPLASWRRVRASYDASPLGAASEPPEKGSLCVVRVLFFLQCASGACLCNFLVLFFHSRGLSKAQVGVMAGAVGPAANILGQPALNYLLDRLAVHKAGMMICLVLSSIGTFCLQFTPTGPGAFYWLAAVSFISSTIGSGCGPLLDSTAIYTLGQHDVPLSDYGKFRVWGAIGWGVTAVAIGLLLDSFGQDMRVLFYGYAAVQGTYILTISTFPVATDGSADSSSDKPSSHPTLSAGEYWVALLSTRGVPLFLVLLLIMGTCKSTVDVFLFLHLQDDLGATSLLLGLTLAVTTVGEVPFFFFSGELLKRFGANKVVVLALAAYVIRLGWYACLGYFHVNVWWVLPVEVLHGLTFSLGWAACATHATEIAPPGYASTTQGVISATFWGFGFVIGGIGGGLLNQAFGADALFFIATAVAFGGVVFGLFGLVWCSAAPKEELWRSAPVASWRKARRSYDAPSIQ